MMKRAASLFLGTYLIFWGYNRQLIKYAPRLTYHCYIGKNQRRLHHYEAGLYFLAVGLALFLEDHADRVLPVEYKEGSPALQISPRVLS